MKKPNVSLTLALLVSFAACSMRVGPKNPPVVAPKEQPVVTPTPQHEVVRAAFDVGSAKSSVKVALVNTDTQTIEKIILGEENPESFSQQIEFKKNLGPDKKLSEDFMRQALSDLKALRDATASAKPTEYVGVATSALREAKNGPAFVERVRQELGINLTIITQESEALLGYAGVAGTVSGFQADRSVVWDIGGNSTQWTARLPDQKFAMFFQENAFASVPTQALLSGDKSKSPNPIGKNKAEDAVKSLSERFAKVLSPQMKSLASKRVVYGIGGIFGLSLPKTVGSQSVYTTADLEEALHKWATATDADLNAKFYNQPKAKSYAATDVSNIILVLACMKAAEIKEVHPVKVDLTYGVLANPGFIKAFQRAAYAPGVPPQSVLDSKLRDAAWDGDWATTHTSLLYGADVDTGDQDGNTALIFAAQRNRIEIVKTILEQKPNLDQMNQEGESALHAAVLHRNLEVACLLLKAGANPDLKGNGPSYRGISPRDLVSKADKSFRTGFEACLPKKGGGGGRHKVG